jgi:hypothetical protein
LKNGNDDVKRKRIQLREERHDTIRQTRLSTTNPPTVTSHPFSSSSPANRPFSYILVDAPFSISTLSLANPSLSSSTSASSMNYSHSQSSLTSPSFASSRSATSFDQPSGFDFDSPIPLCAIESLHDREYENLSLSVEPHQRNGSSADLQKMNDDEADDARNSAYASLVSPIPLFSLTPPATPHRLMKKRRP